MYTMQSLGLGSTLPPHPPPPCYMRNPITQIYQEAAKLQSEFKRPSFHPVLSGKYILTIHTYYDHFSWHFVYTT
jgi:hypothetical protein